MTTVSRRAGHRTACGLAAALIATVFAMSAPCSPATATAASPAQPDRHAGHKRNILRERHIRSIGQPGKAAAPRPRTIDIPAIGVAAGLMTLGGQTGDASDPSLPTPPLARAASTAGWYQFSAVPGTAGNAVIVGHVDTYAGPGVFYNLYQLLPGDAIYVDVGTTRQRFEVTSDRELPKSSFPVNQVFGTTKKHMLWLITCGGSFDYTTRHYLDNILVSAVWVPAPRKTSRRAGAKRSANHR